MAAKVFEVGDVLPAGIIEISVSKYHDVGIENNLRKRGLKSDNNLFNFFTFVYIEDADWPSYYDYYIAGTLFGSCYDDDYGDTVHDWFYRIEIDTSDWSLSKRTISSVQWDTYNYGVYFTWEDITPSGYSITFEENGGSTVTDLTEQTALPSPLPTTTKANHVFAGWYLDSSFTQKAVAGATIESNVTLYAKWYTPATWCEDIADAIREKEGSSGNIKHVDFPERILAIESAVEMSQDDYDALATKDTNTYYIVMEEE